MFSQLPSKELGNPEVLLPVLSILTLLVYSKMALLKKEASKCLRPIDGEGPAINLEPKATSVKDREFRKLNFNMDFLRVYCMFHSCYKLWGVWRLVGTRYISQAVYRLSKGPEMTHTWVK